MESSPLSYDQFMTFKKYSNDVPSELNVFVNKVKLLKMKSKKHTNAWRKHHKSKTSWLVTKKLNQNENEQLISNYRGILNRISSSNFDEMLKELLSLEIDSQENLQVLINLIFKKAVMENNYANMYAKLSHKLYPRYVLNKDNNSKIYFRTLFVEQCQQIFKLSINITTADELKEKPLKSSYEILGFMMFIGELYNYGLLTNSIIYECMLELIFKVAEDKYLSINNLCQLVNIVGKKFSATCPKNFKKILNELDKIMKMSEDKKQKFKIMDILDEY